MATVSEIQAQAPSLTVTEAVAQLKQELLGENRKGAVEALLAPHLAKIVDLAATELARPNPAPEAVQPRPLQPVDPTVGALKPIGSIFAKSGIVVVADAVCIDESWKPRTRAQEGYVVDIVGDHAEYLAKREGSYRITDIPGGKRVHCNNTQEAQVIAAQAETLVRREGWNDTFEVMSRGASYTHALDASRAVDGKVSIAQKAAFEAGVFVTAPGSRVSIYEKDGRLLVG